MLPLVVPSLTEYDVRYSPALFAIQVKIPFLDTDFVYEMKEVSQNDLK